MLRVPQLCGVGDVLVPLPYDLSDIALKRYFEQKFEGQRAVVYMEGLFGTGEISFDIERSRPTLLDPTIYTDSDNPALSGYTNLAVMLRDVEFNIVKTLFEYNRIISAISKMQRIQISSAAGHKPIFAIIVTSLVSPIFEGQE